MESLGGSAFYPVPDSIHIISSAVRSSAIPPECGATILTISTSSANALSPSSPRASEAILAAICFVQPTRIDFNLRPAQGADEETILPVIEDANKLYAEIKHIIGIINKGTVSNPVSRVALYLQFLAQRPSVAEANETVLKAVPRQYGLNIAGEEDFIFQINQPYASSKVDRIKMNCLTKWSVDRIQLLKVSIATSGAPVVPLAGNSSQNYQTVQFIAASMAFDINNIPTETPIPAEQQSSLLLEGLDTAAKAQKAVGLNP